MAISMTKNKQTEKIITKIVSKAFGGLGLKQVTELTEGFFNVAYLITLLDGREVILKIAPPVNSVIMTHENNIMYSEVDSMRMVEKLTDVPVAKILYYDDSHMLCDNDYFFMEKLEGKSFSSYFKQLSDDENAKINYQMGYYNAKLNKITGKKFGYYGQTEKQDRNWFKVFKNMIKDTIDDAERLNIDLKISLNLIFELLDNDKVYFDEVIIPKFVHWDLWAGNIFVVGDMITGLIDFERCMWADELLEVGFRTYGYDENFFNGYGIEKLTYSQSIRAKWYDVYLFLISCLECDYRHYETRDAYNWGTKMLAKWIKEISERQS